MCLWSPLLHGFQSGVHHEGDGVRVHLTVEVMPCGERWEWLAWLARCPAQSRHGFALSAATARRFAEDAARALDRRHAPARADAAPVGSALANRRQVPRRPGPARLPGQMGARPGGRRGRLP
jgi:hypothetical protein